MFSGGRGLFHDAGLFSGIDGYVNDLDLLLAQQFVDSGIDFGDSVVFGSTLGLLTIPIGDADDVESRLLVSGQMRIVDDASGADDTDSTVHAFRQPRSVIEMRENFWHFRASFHNRSRMKAWCAIANSSSNHDL